MQPFSANRSWTPELDRKARALTWLVLDVDGVLTDGLLHVGPDGELFKSFHVRDGLAVKLSRAAGLKVAILSARTSEVVARRAGPEEHHGTGMGLRFTSISAGDRGAIGRFVRGRGAA